ncbi:MAG: FAD-binding oxidoreductase [Candidatus Obscuribacterales bacterium]
MKTTHQRFPDAEQLSAFFRDTKGDAESVVPGSPRPLPKTPAAQEVIFADLGAGLSSITEYTRSDQVISVQCGITIGDLQNELAGNHHWLPVQAAPEQTLLSVVCGGDAGALEHGFGGVRDLVLGLTVMLSDGTTIVSGGKVVKNVTGYDTTKLFVGSHGWLGIPLVAHLRLYALPQRQLTVLYAFPSLDAAFGGLHALLALGLPLSCCELFSAAALKAKGLAPPAVPEGSSYLALQVHGHTQVVDEVSAAAHNALQSDGTRADAAADHIWSSPPADAAAGNARVQITLPPESMRLVLKDPELLILSWQARPWRGGLTFSVLRAAVDSTVAQLKAVVARLKLTASLAHPTDRHWLNVDRVPERDSAADLLKDELKKRFDPPNKLNRLVRL